MIYLFSIVLGLLLYTCKKFTDVLDYCEELQEENRKLKKQNHDMFLSMLKDNNIEFDKEGQ